MTTTQSPTSRIKSLLSNIGTATKNIKQGVTNFLNKPIQVKNPVAQKAVQITSRLAQANPVNIVKQGVAQQRQVFNTPIRVSPTVAKTASRLATATPIKIAQPVISPVKKAFTSWKDRPSNQLGNQLIKIGNERIVKPSVKFAQKFGEAMAQPYVSKMTRESQESMLAQSQLYLEKGAELSRAGDKAGADRYFKASKELTDYASKQINQRTSDLEGSKKELIESGVGTMNAAGILANPLASGSMIGLGGALNYGIEKLLGVNEPGGFMRGVDSASKYAGFVNVSNPIIAGVIGKFAPMINNPVTQNLASRTGNAIGNLIEDRSLSALYGDKPNLTSDLVSLALGFVLGGKGDIKNFESLKKQLSTYGLSPEDNATFVKTVAELMKNRPGYARLDLGLGKDTLPSGLSKAKPRYNYGQKAFIPEFQSDVDRALYITAQTKKSASDDSYRAYLKNVIGMTDEEITVAGKEVRDYVKSQAKVLDGGTQAKPEVITVPDQGTISASPAGKVVVEPTQIESPVKPQSKLNVLELEIKKVGDAIGQVKKDIARETDPQMKATLEQHKNQLQSAYADLKNLQEGNGYIPVDSIPAPKVENAPAPQEARIPVTEGFTPEAQAKIEVSKRTPSQPYQFKQPDGNPPDAPILQKFRNWVNARTASKIEATLKSKEFQDLDAEGINAILRFQAGVKGGLEKVQQYFDAKYEDLKKAGVSMGFEQNYLPQLWANTQDEINQVFGKRLSKNPSFTIKKVFQDYQEGLDKGLTPRYQNISDLIRWYEATANKAMADKGFFTELVKGKFIKPSGNAPSGWVTLSEDHFPKIIVKDKAGKIVKQGTYKASPELAVLINNYLSEPSEALLMKIAQWSNRAKGRVLSFGIPNPLTGGIKLLRNMGTVIRTGKEKGAKAGFYEGVRNFTEGAGTGLNYFGYSMTKRGFGLGLINGLKDLRKQFNPEYSRKSLAKWMPTAPDFVKHGGTLSAENMKGVDDIPSFKNILSEGWNNLFEKTLFEVNIPSSKLENYDMAWKRNVKNGMPEEEAKLAAAHLMNTVYAGKNIDELGRSKNMQNIFRILALAPDWLESNIGMAANTLKSFYNFRDPKGDAYRRMAANWVSMYVVANLIQKATTDKFMVENDPGHELDFEIGYNDDGQKRYWKMSAGADDWVKIPLDAIRGMMNGDFSSLAQALKNRGGVFVQPAIGLMTDKNWAGQPIGYRGKDQYGREMPADIRLKSIASEWLTPLGVPSFVQGTINYGLGKQGLEQTILQGMELPVRYAGGPKSKTQKEVADMIKLRGGSGEDIYNVSKGLAGESLSENQMGLVTQSKDPIATVTQMLKLKKDKAEVKAKNKAGEKTEVVDGGEKWYVQKGDEVQAIDKVWSPTPPTLTGNETIDKKLKSQYKASITARINDVITLLQNEMITIEEAAAEVDKLQGVYEGIGGSGKPKKVTIPKFPVKKMPKLKVTERPIIKIKLPSLPNLSSATKTPRGIRASLSSGYKPVKIRMPKTARRMASTLGGIGRA